jgi:hypothetical protein
MSYNRIFYLIISFQFIFSGQLTAIDEPKAFFVDSLSPTQLLAKMPNIFSKVDYKGPASLSESELASLEEGDFILRKGYGWISDRIAEILDEEYPVTHCGLILRAGFPEPMILHSLSNNRVDGIFVEPLAAFLQESQPGSLVGLRLRCSPEKRQAVVAEAKRLLLKEVPFDLAFDETDSTQLYCAELFGYIFKTVFGKDLLKEKLQFLNQKVIRMRNFFDPKVFEIQFNQFEKSDK